MSVSASKVVADCPHCHNKFRMTFGSAFGPLVAMSPRGSISEAEVHASQAFAEVQHAIDSDDQPQVVVENILLRFPTDNLIVETSAA